MSKGKPGRGDNVNISAGRDINATWGATVGINRSTGKKVPVSVDLATPAGLLTAAVKRLPILWWAVGVAAILALVVIVSRWNVPPAGLVLGGLGLFVGMFGLVLFAALVKPPQKNINPPLISQIALWAFALLLIGSGFLAASSLFFDRPIPLRTQFFGQVTTAAAPH